MKQPVFNPEWPEEVRAVYRHDLQEIWDPTVARHVWNQYHNQLDLYLSLAEGGGELDILDIGCAQATLALLLAERGHKVWAMDIRQSFLDYAASRHERGRVNFICGNAMEIDMAERFDLIFANQIIEHLVHPLEFTKHLSGWLKAGGRLVVTTPNGSYLKNSLPSYSQLGDPSQYDDRQFTADGDGHFFAYRAEELKEVFTKAGFKRIEISYFETPFISGHMKLRHLHRVVPASALKLCDRAALRVPRMSARLAHQLMVVGKLCG